MKQILLKFVTVWYFEGSALVLNVISKPQNFQYNGDNFATKKASLLK